MLDYAAAFFVMAIFAAVLGFSGLAAGAAGIAKILFVVFLIGTVIAFMMGAFVTGRSRGSHVNTHRISHGS